MPTARELVRSDALREAGMYYLEYESVVYTSQGGKTYTIYGSPVGLGPWCNDVNDGD